jgi:hypothetical protein
MTAATALEENIKAYLQKLIDDNSNIFQNIFEVLFKEPDNFIIIFPLTSYSLNGNFFMELLKDFTIELLVCRPNGTTLFLKYLEK